MLLNTLLLVCLASAWHGHGQQATEVRKPGSFHDVRKPGSRLLPLIDWKIPQSNHHLQQTDLRAVLTRILLAFHSPLAGWQVARGRVLKAPKRLHVSHGSGTGFVLTKHYPVFAKKRPCFAGVCMLVKAMQTHIHSALHEDEGQSIPEREFLDSMDAEGHGLLVVINELSRYAPLEAWNLEWSGARPITPGLWQLPDKDAKTVPDGAFELLRPLATAKSLEQLLASAAEVCDVPAEWSLRYLLLAPDVQCAAPVRDDELLRTPEDIPDSIDILCAAARALPGKPSLAPSPRLLLVRTPKSWYLALPFDAPGDAKSRHAAALDIWKSRPYSFSAATDLNLARLAISLASAYHVRNGGSLRDGALLDPCCGSGTVLYAASLSGLRAVGLDLNPKAVQGATANLEFVDRQSADHDDSHGITDGMGASGGEHWGAASCRVLLHDCTQGELPTEARDDVRLVVASLPWGRNQRIPHFGYLSMLLQPIAMALPHATFCLISASPLEDSALAEMRLVLQRAQAIGSRCVLSLLIADRTSDAAHPRTAPNIKVPSTVAEEPLEILHGGGLRTGGESARLPGQGEMIEVQYRCTSGKRAWALAKVVESKAEEGVYIVEWRNGCTAELKLSLHFGPTWRFL